MGFNPESSNSGPSKLTPPEAATAFHHVLAMRYLSEIASAIGKTEDSATLIEQHAKGQAAYHARFYDAKKQAYSPCMDHINATGTCTVTSGCFNTLCYLRRKLTCWQLPTTCFHFLQCPRIRSTATGHHRTAHRLQMQWHCSWVLHRTQIRWHDLLFIFSRLSLLINHR
jgi:hypothetical protein